MLKVGSKGDKVRQLQERLNNLGYVLEYEDGIEGPLAVDGHFGPVTGMVVQLYQSDVGLAVDGVVGPVTWEALFGPIRPVPVVNNLRLNKHGLQELIASEGLLLKPYRCPAGYWTIGVGHLITTEEHQTGTIKIKGLAIPWKPGITRQNVEDLLSQDVGWAEKAVNAAVRVPLTQGQFNALVSFTFNLGQGALLESSLLRLLNQGNYDAVPEKLRLYNKAGRPLKVVPGLVTRREREIKMWRS